MPNEREIIDLIYFSLNMIHILRVFQDFIMAYHAFPPIWYYIVQTNNGTPEFGFSESSSPKSGDSIIWERFDLSPEMDKVQSEQNS